MIIVEKSCYPYILDFSDTYFAIYMTIFLQNTHKSFVRKKIKHTFVED